MSKEWQFISGDNWATCDSCGFKYRASQIKLRWDGLYVCPADWEPRHPQDYVEAKQDKIVADIQRPPPEEIFIEFLCNLINSQGRADYGVADCARADVNFPDEMLPCYTDTSVADLAVSECSVAF